MTTARLLSLSLLFFTAAAVAQPSDIALGVRLPERVAAGADMPVTLSVANLGPNSTLAFILIPHVAGHNPATLGDARCHFSAAAMTCDVRVAAGETVTLNVNLATPVVPGRVTVTAEGFLYPVDYDESNNRASASAELVDAADLTVSIDVRPSFRPLGESTIYFYTLNLAARQLPPEGFITIPPPLQVRGMSPNCAPAGEATFRCTYGLGSFNVFVPARGAPVALTAWVDAEDFDPSNNRVVRVEPIYDLAQLKLEIAADDRLDENATGTIRYSVTNQSDFDASDVVLTLSSSRNAVTASAPGCTADAAGLLTCAIGKLAAGERREIVATVKYKEREGVESIYFFANQPLAPEIIGTYTSTGATVVHYRYFNVTTTADGGAGSLRATIDALNEQCGAGTTPCKIVFELPDGWQTITPRSPLPVIHARHLALDGGGRVFLDGRDAGSGDGLSIEAGTLTVRGFTIGNFPGGGILAAALPPVGNYYDLPSIIENNRLGVDPDGNAAPNGMRGLMTWIHGVRIRGNVVANNFRSGMFLGSWAADVRDNTVAGNGASGIFLGEYATDSVVENNVITGNGQFGVCIGSHGRAEIRANTIAGNGGGAFDVGLDGPTPAGAPRLDAVRIENGETVIEGRVDPIPPPPSYRVTKTVYLFANREVDAEGFAEGEEFLGVASVNADGTFALKVARDLRGRWIDGTVLVVTDYGDAVYRASSEFGRPLLVNE